MQSRYLLTVGMLLSCLIGMAISNFVPGSPAAAQAPNALAGRYQISAYGSTTSAGSVSHGCYIVDTATGQIWYANLGGSPQKVGTLP